jgi:hypothetical protein
MTPARIGKAMFSPAVALSLALFPCAVVRPAACLLAARPAACLFAARPAACLFAARPAHAADDATTIAVTANPNPLSERDSLQLQIVVDSPLTAVVTEPTFDAPDFVKAGSPEMRFQPHAGDFGPNTRKKLVFTFVLLPRKAGDFTISHISTKVGGQPLNANDVSVKVNVDAAGPRSAVTVVQPPSGAPADDESTNPASPNYRGRGGVNPPGAAPAQSSSHVAASAPDRFNSDFTVWASVNKTKAYVGEPIVAEYYVYDYGGVRQTEILQWPNFQGFWREDLEIVSRIDYQETFVKQQEVRRAFIARYALYGIKPGRIQLDKLGVQAKYAPTDVLSPAMVFGMDLRTGKHFSQDLSIDILPLPEKGRPENFGGAVGKFTLKLEADKQVLPQNTPVTFTFTLQGEGNFQAIEAIKLNLPPDFELYEATTSGRPPAPVGSRSELASQKVFKIVAIPRKAGHFDVAPVSWSYFDPEKESYVTLTTNAIGLDVSPNDAAGTNSNSYLAPKNGAPGATPPADELRYLKPVNLGAPAAGPFDALTIALFALLAANFVLAVRFLRGRTRGLVKLVKGIDRYSEARIALLQAKGNRDGDWQAGLEEVVLMVLQVLLETNPRGLARSDLEEQWRNRGLPAPLFQRAGALLDEIDRHRFSSQKLSGSGTKEVRSRLTRETEAFLTEASHAGRKK